MAEAQHTVINVHQNGLKNLQSDHHLSKTNELSAPSHSRSNSCDSSEGLVLSATELQARSTHPAVAKIINNNSQRSELHCCDRKTLGTMGQTGNSAKPCLEDHEDVARNIKTVNNPDDETDCSTPSRHLPNVDISNCAAFTKLEAELASAQKALKLKQEEVDRLSKIREEVESELQDLTASLFEEANRMVQEANIKAAAAERSLMEADMKIDGLETEVAALKTLVLTSTPARPNRQMVHSRHDSKFNGSRPSSASNAQLSSASPALAGLHGISGSSGTLIVGAGGLLGAKADDVLNDDLNWTCCSCDGAGAGNEAEREKFIDPGLRKDFLAWKKDPTFQRGTSEFLERLYREDIDLCLDFPNQKLSQSLRRAIEQNLLCINPLIGKEFDDSSLPKTCALYDAPLLCRFHVRLLADESDPKISEMDFFVCQLARNRIIAVCDCLTYLRYIKQGMVKSHHNDVYWQILDYRKKMALARLGFAPE